MKIFKVFLFTLCILSLTLLTSCEKKSVSLIYMADGGMFLNDNDVLSYTYKEGDTVELISEVPTKFNYEFDGWCFEDGKKVEGNSFTINKNTTLIASWKEKLYKVTFKLIEGAFSDGSTEKTVEYKLNQKVTLLDGAQCNGKVFNGWKYNDLFIEESLTVTKDIEIVGEFVTPGEEYSISFVLNGGSFESNVIETYNSNVRYRLPIPTFPGYEFVGWYTDSEFYSSKVEVQKEDVTGNKVYYAKWKLVDSSIIDTLVDDLVPDIAWDNFSMPTNYHGVKIVWESDKPETITTTGKVIPSHRKEIVGITAKITYESQEYEFYKEVVVNAVKFKKDENPIAGYFYQNNIAIKSDVVLNNLDIAYYAFANLSESGGIVIEGMSNFEKFIDDAIDLRKKGIQMVLSVAGGASNFASACRGEGYKSVGKQLVELVKKYHLDGIDIDWEFPRNNTDKQNMLLLAQYLRLELTKLEDGTGSPYLVTAAIPSHTSYAQFDLKNLNNCLDYVNMMSYDMHSSYKSTHNCPLFSAYNDGNAGNGIDRGISYFTSAGLDKDKIIIGAAYYGKAFKVTGTAKNPTLYPGLGASATPFNLQLSSSYTVFYSYIVNNILTNPQYVRYWDKDACLPYLYNESSKIFITYEDKESVKKKAEYAYQEGVGIMFWEYSYDYNNELTDTICKTIEDLKKPN